MMSHHTRAKDDMQCNFNCHMSIGVKFTFSVHLTTAFCNGVNRNYKRPKRKKKAYKHNMVCSCHT